MKVKSESEVALSCPILGDPMDCIPLPTTQDSTHGHHQMANTEIRLTILFAAKDGEALYNQQKQDRELTVA